MAIYAFGDIQGCYDELQALIKVTGLDPKKDKLWFTGDLVNRGPRSLEVLRLVRSLGTQAVTTLGNHDLHLLAVAHGSRRKKPKKDTFDKILNARDRDELLDWLRHQPLVHRDGKYLLVHAGLPPQWTPKDALRYAREVERALRGPKYGEFLNHMYGDTPKRWDPALTGWERLRCITNCLTRIRFIDGKGALSFSEKGRLGSQPAALIPWYAAHKRASREVTVVFGHWSTLRISPKDAMKYNVRPLDTGCLWGGKLTAFKLNKERYFHTPALNKIRPGK